MTDECAADEHRALATARAVASRPTSEWTRDAIARSHVRRPMIERLGASSGGAETPHARRGAAV
jgi:hypothetical protein